MRKRFWRISAFTERETVRASKSGMRFNSPSVRAFGCPEDCSEVVAVMGSRSASQFFLGTPSNRVWCVSLSSCALPIHSLLPPTAHYSLPTTHFLQLVQSLSIATGTLAHDASLL